MKRNGTRRNRVVFGALIFAALAILVGIGCLLPKWLSHAEVISDPPVPAARQPSEKEPPSRLSGTETNYTNSPDRQKRVPPAITEALAAVTKVPGYRVTVHLAITPTTPEDETAERAHAYQILYDPKSGIQTKALVGSSDAEKGEEAQARISLDLVSFLTAVKELGKDYSTENEILDGRPHFKVTTTIGDTGAVSNLWIDADRLYTSKVEASLGPGQAPSLKIRAWYKEWQQQFVVREAIIESGGQRAVLKYADYQALSTP